MVLSRERSHINPWYQRYACCTALMRPNQVKQHCLQLHTLRYRVMNSVLHMPGISCTCVRETDGCILSTYIPAQAACRGIPRRTYEPCSLRIPNWTLEIHISSCLSIYKTNLIDEGIGSTM